VGYIDADAHVIECEATWDYFDPSERQYRPVTFEVPSAPGSAAPPKQVYLIGETLCRRFPSDCKGSGFGNPYTPAVSHLEDAGLRLRCMDSLGIDVQIVISTSFIGAETGNPVIEAAVMRSWNRWMAERTAGAQDRLRWLLMCPVTHPERAWEELEFGARNGAAGVMLKGMLHGRFLSDPSFYPLYERAQDLNLTMVVHQGAMREHIEGLGLTTYRESSANFFHYTATVAKGLFAVLASDLNKRFPRLRWAFVEAGSCWLPAVFHQYIHSISSADPNSYVQTHLGPGRVYTHVNPAENIYIACDADEDLPYLTARYGEEQFLVGSDFCHNDLGSNPLAHTQVMERTDLPERVRRRIVDTNGRKAFAIPEDFTPTAGVREPAMAVF